MSAQEALQRIKQAIHEEQPPAALLHLMEESHAALLEADPEERFAFEEEVATLAGGLYIPHLFWMYLAGFKEEPEAYRASLEALLLTFAKLPSQPMAEDSLRLLLYVYFSEEDAFHLERLWHQIEQEATYEKILYFQHVRQLIEKNPTTVRIFREKYHLLAPFFPNFDQLRLPLPQVRSLVEG